MLRWFLKDFLGRIIWFFWESPKEDDIDPSLKAISKDVSDHFERARHIDSLDDWLIWQNDRASKTSFSDDPVSTAISDALNQTGLDIAFWAFTTKDQSNFSRGIENGEQETQPMLSLYLRFRSQLDAEHADMKSGNWDDSWPPTQAVRIGLNQALSKFETHEADVSDNTFIFLARSFEETAFGFFGNRARLDLMPVFQDMSLPTPDRIHWVDEGEKMTYFLEFPKKYCKRVSNEHLAQIHDKAVRFIKERDTLQACKSYPLDVKLVTKSTPSQWLDREGWQPPL